MTAAVGSGGAPSRVHPGLIDRTDLVDILDRAVERRVTIVTAPAGSGKTSLLRAWAGRSGQSRRIAFLSVRPGQHDAQLFWLALLDAVRAVAGTDGDAQPPAIAPGRNGGIVVDKLLSELAAFGGPLVLVIDDLHELASPEALGDLAGLLTSLPRSVHAVLATRRDLPLSLHQLRLAGELSEIRAAQLRFTQDETRDLLAAAGITVPVPVAAMLHQRTEGWAAGLRLAVLSLAGHPDPERFVAEFSGSDRTVAEYLMAEMLSGQPPTVQDLLMRTAILDRVNGELADLLTGSAGSERILLNLEDANAFVLSVDPGRTLFRYHHLFGGLLRLELRRKLPEQIPQLHRLAARWLADHGQVAEAIHHLQSAGDWPRAAALLTDHALSLTLDGRAATVAALLGSFPAHAVGNLPELALVHAIADLEQLRLDEAAARLQVARSHAATVPPGRRHRLEMALAALGLMLARLRGHFVGMLEQADTLGTAPDGQPAAEVALASDLRALALLNLGVAEAWSMRLADSERHLLEGVDLARRIGRPYLEVACLAQLAFASTTHSCTLARQRCEEAIALAARHGWDAAPVIAPALATLAGTLIWAGDFDHGEQWLDRAKRVTQSEGEPGIRLLVHLISAALAAARGQHRKALADLAAAATVQALMAGDHALTGQVTAWTIAAQARLGMTGQARSALDALDGMQAAADGIRNAAAVVRLAEHDPVGARREIEAALDRAAGADPRLTRVEAHLLDALACRDLGDERAARQAIGRALSLAEPDRLILPFAMTGAWELLQALPTQETAHAALVAEILDAVVGRAPASAGQPVPEAVEQLSPSELRVLRYLPTNLTRPEIADDLSVSVHTISTHIRRIYAKLGVTNRSSAVQRSRALRLLSPGR
jgi:LuxR family transcriptional regulator, maltose regulon positive regulatory protein